jgi:hypothetical protein
MFEERNIREQGEMIRASTSTPQHGNGAAEDGSRVAGWRQRDECIRQLRCAGRIDGGFRVRVRRTLVAHGRFGLSGLTGATCIGADIAGAPIAFGLISLVYFDRRD